ncbi:MAG TPA: hypothetical protein VMB79_08095 [Jatrophihabitans sp.]|nr:hypothetical protein [Jatrophihabitans sp.]
MFGRSRPPAALRALIGSDERLLAVADGEPAETGAVVATQLRLWVPEAGSWRAIGWDAVVKATWSEAGLAVTEGVEGPDGLVTDLFPVRHRLAEPRNLPVVVRQRVERSIDRWEQVRVPGGTGRVVGRRRPGVDGLHWTARFDTGTPDTPAARTVLLDYLDRVRVAQRPA